MNETQFKPGDLVKFTPNGSKGIVVEVRPELTSVYWFNWGEVTRTRNSAKELYHVILLSRGHNNENE